MGNKCYAKYSIINAVSIIEYNKQIFPYLPTSSLSDQSDFAFSNFLPLDLTYGFVWDPGTPGAGPKCFLASLSFDPLSRSVFVPIN